jgi:hypothetical protein
MKKLGKLVILTFAEYESLMCRTEDAEAHAADFAEELDRVRSNYEIDVLDAFNAGKFHAAGGYGKALKAVRAKLQETETLLLATASQRFEMQHLLEKWQPLVEALETTPGQFTVVP